MGKRFAIIVGIQDYSKVGCRDLQFTSNDAIQLANVLISNAGFEKENVALLCDAIETPLNLVPSAPTRSDVLAALNRIAKTAGPDDFILFYFAGHGGEIGSNHYLLTNDTRPDVLKDTSLPVTMLNDYFQKTKAGTTIRIFDACRSAISDTRSFIDTTMTRNLEKALLMSAKGSAAFSSCSSGETALEHSDLKQGVFTYFLCKGIEGEAADNKGLVRWDALVDYVKHSVEAWCKAQSFPQKPHAVSDFSGVLEFSKKRMANTEMFVATQEKAKPSIATIFNDFVNQKTITLSPHLRDFSMTDNLILNQISEQVKKFATDFCSELNSSQTNATCESVESFASSESHVFLNFSNDIKGKGIEKEYTGEFRNVRLRIVPHHVTIPASDLIIVTARFQFFIWLWHYYRCVKSTAHTDWTPAPTSIKGSCILKPKIAQQPGRINDILTPIVERCTSIWTGWADQSKEHFESRVAIARKNGDFIE